MRIPAEVTDEEIELIKGRLSTQNEREVFEDCLTTDPIVADPIDVVRMPLEKAAWIKAPCCFLAFKKGRKGQRKMRASCSIYKVRPEICRVFHCGKENVDEPLLYRRYEYELTPKFTAFMEGKIKETNGDKGCQEMREMILKAQRELMVDGQEPKV